MATVRIWTPILLIVAVVALVIRVGLSVKRTGQDHCSQEQSAIHYARCKQNLESLANALEMYRQCHGRYPDSIAELQLPGGPTAADGSRCPATAKPYRLVIAPEGRGYTVSCDGNAHTEVGIPAGFPRYNSRSGPNFPAISVATK